MPPRYLTKKATRSAFKNPPYPLQRKKLAGFLYMARNSKILQDEFYLPDHMEMEDKALRTQAMADLVAIWSIPFYAQRQFWFKLFIGFNYGLFAPLLTHWTLKGIPSPEFSNESIELYRYLGGNSGLAPMHEVFPDLASPARRLKSKLSVPSFTRNRKRNSNMADAASEVSRISSFSSLKSNFILDGFHSGVRRLFSKSDITVLATTAELTENPRQSKLSQEQLSELQRSTHFDKKELQQWYKGEI